MVMLGPIVVGPVFLGGCCWPKLVLGGTWPGRGTALCLMMTFTSPAGRLSGVQILMESGLATSISCCRSRFI